MALAKSGGQMNGAAVAIVNSTSDKGRVELRYPWLAGGAGAQARYCVPFGMSAAKPQIGDEVLVLFEHGDINRPVVVGKLSR